MSEHAGDGVTVTLYSTAIIKQLWWTALLLSVLRNRVLPVRSLSRILSKMKDKHNLVWFFCNWHKRHKYKFYKTVNVMLGVLSGIMVGVNLDEHDGMMSCRAVTLKHSRKHPTAIAVKIKVSAFCWFQDILLSVLEILAKILHVK